MDDATGMVCNLVDLDGFVQREILERFDLENLNTAPRIQARRAHDGKPLHSHL